jgi:hypothetical protein
MGQVLQPLGTGLPGRVVASYASETSYFALYEALETEQQNDYTLAEWDGVSWKKYPGLETPEPIVPTSGTYNFHSLAYFQGEIYVGAYIANASKDAEIPVTHLYKWSKTKSQWVPEIGVVDTRNNGIISMTVFDGRLIVAGKFQSNLNGNSVQNIAAYDGNEWTYLGTNELDQGANGTIRSLMVVKDRLYIAGDFSRFAGDLTGNIAYYTASNGGWGGIGSPFEGEILELATFGDNIAALGKRADGKNEVRIFQVNWSDPISFDSFQVAKPTTITGLSDYLLIGGEFIKNSSGSSLLRFQNAELNFTGNRLTGHFTLGQRGTAAFVWGNFTEQNTDIRYFSSLEFATGNLVGDLFYDENNNCIKDDGEVGIPHAVIRLMHKNHGKSYFAVSDGKGKFTASLPEGEYIIEHMSRRHMRSFCTQNYQTQIRNGRYSQAILGEYMDSKITDLGVQLKPIYPAVLNAGDTIESILFVTNHGPKTLKTGTVHLTHALPLADFYSIPAADDYNGIHAVYTIQELQPFETRSILVRFRMPFTATETDKYTIEAKTGSLISASDEMPADNLSETQLSIGKRGNTYASVWKRSDNGGEIAQNKRTWSYSVDFRNLSSQTVNKAILIDTLSSLLPLKRAVLTSFYPTDARFYIQQGRILVVDFNPANLKSAESNSSSSSGWVNYQLDLFDDMPLNTRIYNTAYVDFDSKWVGKSEAVEVLVVKGTNHASVIAKNELYPFPNPVASEFEVTWTSKEIGNTWQLINGLGQTMKQGRIDFENQKICISELPNGVYVLKSPLSQGKIQIWK